MGCRLACCPCRSCYRCCTGCIDLYCTPCRWLFNTICCPCISVYKAMKGALRCLISIVLCECLWRSDKKKRTRRARRKEREAKARREAKKEAKRDKKRAKKKKRRKDRDDDEDDDDDDGGTRGGGIAKKRGKTKKAKEKKAKGKKPPNKRHESSFDSYRADSRGDSLESIESASSFQSQDSGL